MQQDARTARSGAHRSSERVRGLVGRFGARDSTQRNALIAFAIRVASAGIAYLSQVLLARWMGTFEYGVFVYIWVWVIILGGLGPLGLSTSALRFIPEYLHRKRSLHLRGFLWRSRLIALGVATVLMLAGMAGLVAFGDRLASYYVVPAYLALICLPMYALSDVQDGISRAFGWVDVGLAPPYIIRPLLLLAAMLAAHQAGFAPTAVTAMGAAIFASWGSALLQVALLRGRVGTEKLRGAHIFRTGPWLAASLPVFLVYIFQLLLQNVDTLILSHYWGPRETAVYFAALKSISLMSFIQFAVAAAAAAKLSTYDASGDRSALASFVAQTVRWTFWPSLAFGAVLLALGLPLLWLFGPDFSAGYPAMAILALGYLMKAATGPAEYTLSMLGQQRACAQIVGLSAAADIALNFLLVPPYGLVGAATATAASFAILSLLLFVVAKRRLGLHLLVVGAPAAVTSSTTVSI